MTGWRPDWALALREKQRIEREMLNLDLTKRSANKEAVKLFREWRFACHALGPRLLDYLPKDEVVQ